MHARLEFGQENRQKSPWHMESMRIQESHFVTMGWRGAQLREALLGHSAICEGKDIFSEKGEDSRDEERSSLSQKAGHKQGNISFHGALWDKEKWSISCLWHGECHWETY